MMSIRASCLNIFAIGFLFLIPYSVKGQSIDWQRQGNAPWEPRDSQAEYAFAGKMWIAGGWKSSFEAPPRDVWASEDGRNWERVASEAPWIHSDLPMSCVFRERMWMLGGWYNGRLPGHSASNQVWSSQDGLSWKQVNSRASWSARLAGVAVAHRDRLWLLGGIENYYFGDEQSLKNDVWSSEDGNRWILERENANWKPRAYHQAVSHRGRIYVLGGGNYVPQHHARNDVWSSADGKDWICETENAPWEPRLWFSAAVYRDRIWVLGGWSKEKDNFGDVWSSPDGKNWTKLETKNCWKPRHEHSAFVLNDRLWVVGGHARPLSNEVWSLELPSDW
jgi:hypothetical protein